MSNDILALIQDSLSGLSKGQKQIANYILSNYDKAAFMTASKLGKTVNVSESTVVRFAAELGFDGYPDMQKTLQEMIRSKLTSIQRIEVSRDRMGSQDVLSMVMHSDIEKIRMTLEDTDQQSFTRAVECLERARRVYILGVRSAGALADFLGYYLRFMFDDVTVVDTSAMSEVFEQVLRVRPGDVLIGLSFPRYSRRTVKAMKYVKAQGATVIAVTDSHTSPLVPYADVTLLAKSDMASFVDSLVAPLSLVNALIVAVSQRRREQLETTLGQLEQIWSEYDEYEKPDER